MLALLIEKIGIDVIIAVFVTLLVTGIPLVKSWLGKAKLKNELKDKEKKLEEKEKNLYEKENTWRMKIKDLEDKIRRDNHATLHFGSLQHILELGLVKTNISGTKFIKEPLQENIQEKWFRDDYRDYYLEVATFSFDATYSVDLSQVFVKQDSQGIIIYGLKVVGPKRTDEKWHSEYRTVVRYFAKKEKTSDGKEINVLDETKHDDLTDDYLNNVFNQKTINQIATIRDRVKEEFYQRCDNGHEVSYVNEVVLQKAEIFLRGIFAPVSKNVEFCYDRMPDNRAITLKKYCEDPTALEWRN